MNVEARCEVGENCVEEVRNVLRSWVIFI